MEGFNQSNFYVNRDKELEDISFGLQNYTTVVIVGEWGMGKTTLLNLYIKKNPLNYSQISLCKGFELEFDDTKVSSLNIPVPKGERTLTVIDGLDEILSSDKRRKVVQLVKEGRKYGHKVILTVRPFSDESGILNNSYVIKLKGLSEADAFSLIRNRVAHDQLSENDFNDIKEIIDFFHNSPSGIIAASDSINSSKLNPAQLLRLLGEKVTFKDSVLGIEGERKIILPETPKIVSDVKVINSTLIDRVKETPDFIYSMTSRQFEEFVADLLEKEGYKVTLTKQTHDGGKDLFIVENRRIGKFLYYVECKKYSADHPVGVRLVRELYGTVIADRATAGLLVTSSYFSKEAKAFTEQIKTQISLLEFADLKNWVSQF